MAKIKAVWLPVPAEGLNLDPEGAHVGYDGITKIIERDEYLGDHSIKWFDVFKGDCRVKSFNGRYVADVHYFEEG